MTCQWRNLRTWQPDLGVDNKKNRPLTHTHTQKKKGLTVAHLRTHYKSSNNPPPVFSTPLPNKIFCIRPICTLHTLDVGDLPVFVSRQRVHERKPKAPPVLFSPRYSTTGLLQRIPDDLIWQCVGAQQGSSALELSWQTSRALGLLPLPGRVSLNTPLYY